MLRKFPFNMWQLMHQQRLMVTVTMVSSYVVQLTARRCDLMALNLMQLQFVQTSRIQSSESVLAVIRGFGKFSKLARICQVALML